MVLTPGKQMGAKVKTSNDSLERDNNANEDSKQTQHNGVASILEVRNEIKKVRIRIRILLEQLFGMLCTKGGLF